MRIWDITPKQLCRQHLLGEQRELHAISSIHVNNKKGDSNHPEKLSWKRKLKAPYIIHEEIIKEMKKRGFNHKSPLKSKFTNGNDVQSKFVNSGQDQIKIIKSKKCNCKLK